jgi:hypothetical protein
MTNSSEQLKKYKDIKNKLQKSFPKGNTNWLGFTIDICYGGNKEADIKRVSLGGVASEQNLGDDFLKLIMQSTEDQIDFWQKAVLQDIAELEKALKH